MVKVADLHLLLLLYQLCLFEQVVLDYPNQFQWLRLIPILVEEVSKGGKRERERERKGRRERERVGGKKGGRSEREEEREEREGETMNV